MGDGRMWMWSGFLLGLGMHRSDYRCSGMGEGWRVYSEAGGKECTLVTGASGHLGSSGAAVPPSSDLSGTRRPAALEMSQCEGSSDLLHHSAGLYIPTWFRTPCIVSKTHMPEPTIDNLSKNLCFRKTQNYVKINLKHQMLWLTPVIPST
jgi:hypothetical protein